MKLTPKKRTKVKSELIEENLALRERVKELVYDVECGEDHNRRTKMKYLSIRRMRDDDQKFMDGMRNMAIIIALALKDSPPKSITMTHTKGDSDDS